MLRITPLDSDEGQTLRVEGRLADRWVQELSAALAGIGGGPPPMRLDLSGVTYVDRAGAALLRAFQERGIELIACSAFVRSLISGGVE